ncbi:MAG: hypothetical protein OXH86_19360 [Acidimicrobiaceae bacterium]|nr:hypothetical protein [Acidimicrobiaceae bacterium]
MGLSLLYPDDFDKRAASTTPATAEQERGQHEAGSDGGSYGHGGTGHLLGCVTRSTDKLSHAVGDI